MIFHLKSGVCMFRRKKEGADDDLDDTEFRVYPDYPLKMCPLCSRSYDDGSSFCRYDGQKLAIVDVKTISGTRKEIKCPYCENTVVPVDHGICPICRNVIVPSSSGRGMRIRLRVEGLYPIDIDEFPYRFGRKDISRLPHSEYINPYHLEFSVVDNRIMIRDHRSLNGTKLNETVIGGKNKSYGYFAVRDGDTIELGLNEDKKGLIKMKVSLYEW